jgi:hypothetical protein
MLVRRTGFGQAARPGAPSTATWLRLIADRQGRLDATIAGTATTVAPVRSAVSSTERGWIEAESTMSIVAASPTSDRKSRVVWSM